MVDLDGFDGLPGVEELNPLSAGCLVSTSQRFGLPVSPVDKVLKQSQRHYSLDVIVGHWNGTNNHSGPQLHSVLLCIATAVPLIL